MQLFSLNIPFLAAPPPRTPKGCGLMKSQVGPRDWRRAAPGPDVFVSIPSLQAADSPAQVDFISPSSLRAGSVPVPPCCIQPGVVGAPRFLLPPLRLFIHNFYTFSVTSPVAAANSPLQCSWNHFPLFQDEESAPPLGIILALCYYSHFPPCFAPSLSSPQPGLCPEH